MARVYATRDDLLAFAAIYAGAYVVPAEPAASGLLALASKRVEGMVSAPYDVDRVTLLPTSTDVAEALRDATCALVLQHAESISGSGGGYTTVSIGSVTLTGSGSAAGGASGSPLGPDPREILAAAGLLSNWVYV